MNRLGTLALSMAALLCLGVAFHSGGAIAQQKTLKEQLVGNWTLVSLVEEYQDGKKEYPLGPKLNGMMMLDGSGNFSFFIIGSDRAKSTGHPLNPVGPVSAYFGTYSAGEEEKSLTWHIKGATFPNFEGTDLKAAFTIKMDELKVVRSLPSPRGPFVSTQEWRRIK